MLTATVTYGDVGVSLAFHASAYSTDMVDDLARRATISLVAAIAAINELAEA